MHDSRKIFFNGKSLKISAQIVRCWLNFDLTRKTAENLEDKQLKQYSSHLMIRRLVTMAEAVDVKAGVRNVLERIEAAAKTRPEKVKSVEMTFLKTKTKLFWF